MGSGICDSEDGGVSLKASDDVLRCLHDGANDRNLSASTTVLVVSEVAGQYQLSKDDRPNDKTLPTVYKGRDREVTQFLRLHVAVDGFASGEQELMHAGFNDIDDTGGIRVRGKPACGSK